MRYAVPRVPSPNTADSSSHRTRRLPDLLPYMSPVPDTDDHPAKRRRTTTDAAEQRLLITVSFSLNSSVTKHADIHLRISPSQYGRLAVSIDALTISFSSAGAGSAIRTST